VSEALGLYLQIRGCARIPLGSACSIDDNCKHVSVKLLHVEEEGRGNCGKEGRGVTCRSAAFVTRSAESAKGQRGFKTVCSLSFFDAPK
jgi:hypothetical protein